MENSEGIERRIAELEDYNGKLWQLEDSRLSCLRRVRDCAVQQAESGRQREVLLAGMGSSPQSARSVALSLGSARRSGSQPLPPVVPPVALPQPPVLLMPRVMPVPPVVSNEASAVGALRRQRAEVSARVADAGRAYRERIRLLQQQKARVAAEEVEVERQWLQLQTEKADPSVVPPEPSTPDPSMAAAVAAAVAMQAHANGTEASYSPKPQSAAFGFGSTGSEAEAGFGLAEVSYSSSGDLAAAADAVAAEFGLREAAPEPPLRGWGHQLPLPVDEDDFTLQGSLMAGGSLFGSSSGVAPRGTSGGASGSRAPVPAAAAESRGLATALLLEERAALEDERAATRDVRRMREEQAALEDERQATRLKMSLAEFRMQEEQAALDAEVEVTRGAVAQARRRMFEEEVSIESERQAAREAAAIARSRLKEEESTLVAERAATREAMARARQLLQEERAALEDERSMTRGQVAHAQQRLREAQEVAAHNAEQQWEALLREQLRMQEEMLHARMERTELQERERVGQALLKEQFRVQEEAMHARLQRTHLEESERANQAATAAEAKVRAAVEAGRNQLRVCEASWSLETERHEARLRRLALEEAKLDEARAQQIVAVEEEVARIKAAKAEAVQRAGCEEVVAQQLSNLLREGVEREVSWTQQLASAEALREKAEESARRLQEHGQALQAEMEAQATTMLRQQQSQQPVLPPRQLDGRLFDASQGRAFADAGRADDVRGAAWPTLPPLAACGASVPSGAFGSHGGSGSPHYATVMDALSTSASSGAGYSGGSGGGPWSLSQGYGSAGGDSTTEWEVPAASSATAAASAAAAAVAAAVAAEGGLCGSSRSHGSSSLGLGPSISARSGSGAVSSSTAGWPPAALLAAGAGSTSMRWPPSPPPQQQPSPPMAPQQAPPAAEASAASALADPGPWTAWRAQTPAAQAIAGSPVPEPPPAVAGLVPALRPVPVQQATVAAAPPPAPPSQRIEVFGQWLHDLPDAYGAALVNIEQHGWQEVHPADEPPVWTVLHWAASEDRADLCLRLLGARADPLRADDQGLSALDYAQQAAGNRQARSAGSGDEDEHPSAWRVLVEALQQGDGSGCESPSCDEYTDGDDGLPVPPVYAAAIAAVERYGWETVHGGDFEWTALHWAAAEGRAAICARLLRCSADPGQPDNLGRSALEYAHETDDEATLRVLLEGAAAFSSRAGSPTQPSAGEEGSSFGGTFGDNTTAAGGNLGALLAAPAPPAAQPSLRGAPAMGLYVHQDTAFA